MGRDVVVDVDTHTSPGREGDRGGLGGKEGERGSADYLARFLREHWHVIGARALIERYGLDAVHDVLEELAAAGKGVPIEGVRSPAGLLVHLVKARAQELGRE